MPRALTRRLFLGGNALLMAAPRELTAAVEAADHLLLGVSDLDRGIAWVEERIGLRPAIGGTHPGAGTRNALLPLGGRHYLEIIAPDPAQSAFHFQIDIRGLAEPRLITWAAATSDIEATARMARSAGYRLFGPQNGSRQTPSGRLLRWRTLGVLNELGAGSVEPIPFFIQWAADSPHPSQDPPAGCELQSLRFEHPNPPALAAALQSLGLKGEIAQAGAVRLAARVKGPKGSVELT